MNMNEKMKGKYTTLRPVMGYPAKARTGNSHGPTADKVPAKVPCKRAPAGPGSFKAMEHAPNPRVMVIDAKTGHRVMVSAAEAGLA